MRERMFNITLYLVILSLIIGCTSPILSAEPTVIPTEGAIIPPVETKHVSAATQDLLATSQADDRFYNQRVRMVADQIEARGVDNPEVLKAMLSVPRHMFIPSEYIDQAYEDHPLPIGYGQTISQPYIVALMTESLELNPGDRVLEIGTGSGYQAAVLEEMGMDVFTVEIIPELTEQATQRLVSLGYTEIQVLNADGYFGWEEHAPYNAIIVTAAPDHLPQPLIDQLSEGGILVIPIGPIGAVQTLWVFEKVKGEIEALNLGPVRFVPLTGEH